MAYQIKIPALPADTTIVIAGKTAFARVIHRLSDKELDDRNKNSKYPDRDPYYELVIKNPTIEEMYHKNKKPLTEAEKLIVKTFFEERLYKRASDPSATFIAVKSKSKYPPKLYENINKQATEKTYCYDNENRDLNQNLDCVVITSTFKPNGGNQGWGLNAVIINEPITLYTTSQDLLDYFADRGITVIKTEPSKESAEETAPQSYLAPSEEKPQIEGIVMEGETNPMGGINMSNEIPFNEIPF